MLHRCNVWTLEENDCFFFSATYRYIICYFKGELSCLRYSHWGWICFKCHVYCMCGFPKRTLGKGFFGFAMHWVNAWSRPLSILANEEMNVYFILSLSLNLANGLHLLCSFVTTSQKRLYHHIISFWDEKCNIFTNAVILLCVPVIKNC